MDPQDRSPPANVTVLRAVAEALDLDHPQHGNGERACLDLCIVGFFWMLRPAEYLHSSDDPKTRSQAFRVRDVAITMGGRVCAAIIAPLNDANIDSVTQVTLTFTDQKNAVKGECIAHRPTNDPLLCPSLSNYYSAKNPKLTQVEHTCSD